jgi:hypothetical protein
MKEKSTIFLQFVKGGVLLLCKGVQFRQKVSVLYAQCDVRYICEKTRGRVCLLLFLDAENNGCGSNGKQCPVVNNPSFTVSENFIVYECAGIARPVSQNIFDVSIFITGGIDDTVCGVDAWVVGHDGTVGFRSFHKPAYHIVTHIDGDNLFVMKHVFYHVEITTYFPLRLLAFLLRLVCFRGSCQSYRKFLATVWASESQDLSRRITRFVKCDIIPAFGTT